MLQSYTLFNPLKIFLGNVLTSFSKCMWEYNIFFSKSDNLSAFERLLKDHILTLYIWSCIVNIYVLSRLVPEELCIVGNFLCIYSFCIIPILVLGKPPGKLFQLITFPKKIWEFHSHWSCDTSVLLQMQLFVHDISKCVCKCENGSSDVSQFIWNCRNPNKDDCTFKLDFNQAFWDEMAKWHTIIYIT